MNSQSVVTFLLRGLAQDIIRAVDPFEAMEQHWAQVPGGAMAVLAAGKGARGMIATAAYRLGDRLTRALVVCPPGDARDLERLNKRVQVLPADHPLPTVRNVHAGEEVLRFVSHVRADERLLALISGGGSAMLCVPREPLVLEDVVRVTDDLLRSGATIGQVNCVRKHLELLKGGQLARACEGSVSAFVLSDVLGDRLDVIASGPFAPDPTSFADALEVIERRGLKARHGAVVRLLERGIAGLEPETPGPGDEVFDRVEHVVIAKNASAVAAAGESLRKLGFEVVEERTGVEGEAGEVGKRLGALVRGLGASEAIVWGGETTVTVGDSPGKGGRNQELALAAAIEIDGACETGVLSLATDGVDGPTDAAGGVVDGESVQAMRAAGVDPVAALAAHNSKHALEACGGLLVTGPSGTNVNDVMVAVVV